jgi:hypothetical protein
MACFSQEKDGGCSSAARSRRPGGVNSLSGDGSVRFIKDGVGAMTWVQVGSISGGEVVSSGSY